MFLREQYSSLGLENSYYVFFFGTNLIIIIVHSLQVAKNTFTNYRGLAENNRQIAEQGYKYGQILANAQKEYDTSPNPNTKKMLDNAQRDYDNYTRNNKVAQVAAAAGRAGKSINNAFNDVQKAVGEGVENAVGTVRGIPGRVSDATGLTARNRSQQARANADELNSRAESDQRKAEGARRLVGDNTPEVERFADNQQRNADNSRAAAQRAERTAQNAESAYRSTPLGRAESIAKDLKDSAGTAVDAKIAATKAVKDAVSDYWDVVDQYGANSPQAKAAAKQAESQLNSTAVKLIGNFGNAKNTIEGVIDSGNKYLDELTDGRWSAYEYSWDGPLTRRTTDTRDGSYFTDNLLTGKRTYVKPTTVNTNSPAADDDDKKRKR